MEPKAGYEVSQSEKETRKAITGNSVWRHPKLAVQERPQPILQPDQVLIEVKACGVCGSDMHFYETDKEGYILYPGLTRFPTILGHELSGKVVEVGAQVADLKVATRSLWRNDLVRLLHTMPRRFSQPLSEPGGNRLYHRWRIRQLYRHRGQILLEGGQHPGPFR